MRTKFLSFLLLLFLLLSLPGAALGDEPEEFGSLAEPGRMKQGRFNHTVTLLADGKVLVVGGTADGRRSLDSAEIFDPATGTWALTAAPGVPRMRHSTTLLHDGRVLVVGGYKGGGGGYPSLYHHFNGTGNVSLAECQLFGPTSGSWSPASPLETGRFWQGCVGLPDGKVLIIGGLNVSQGSLASCELYDPETESWNPAAALNTARARFTTTLLQNGSVLVTGGHSGLKKSPFSSCEIYVPGEDAWYNVSSMKRARGYHAAQLLTDGRVLVSGGFFGPGQPDHKDAEIFDPATGKWSLAGEMALPRHNHVTALLPGGKLMVFGGSNCQTGGAHSGIEYYDPAGGEWQDSKLVMLGVKWSVATSLPNGSVFITGGRACDVASSATYLYLPPVEKEDDDDSGFLPAFGIPALVLALAAALPTGGEEIKKKKGKLPDLSHELVIVLGALVMGLCSPFWALGYLVLAGIGTLWFLASICPHCKAHGTSHCQSGYGHLSSKFFKKRETPEFKKAFKWNIGSVALQWFVPVVGAACCLYQDFDWLLSGVLVVFMLVAFVWLPTRSKKEGCARCPQRKDCPWTKEKKNELL